MTITAVKTKAASASERAMSSSASDLLLQSDTALKKLMREGHAIDEHLLEGWQFLGLNKSLGAKIIGRQRFIKRFYRQDTGYGELLCGDNLLVDGGAPFPEYHPIRTNGHARIQGFYLVQKAGAGRWRHYPHAAFLHYGRGDNPWYDPAGWLRDYLVMPFPGQQDILLGAAYAEIGPILVFSNYFVLERDRQIEEEPHH